METVQLINWVSNKRVEAGNFVSCRDLGILLESLVYLVAKLFWHIYLENCEAILHQVVYLPLEELVLVDYQSDIAHLAASLKTLGLTPEQNQGKLPELVHYSSLLGLGKGHSSLDVEYLIDGLLADLLELADTLHEEGATSRLWRSLLVLFQLSIGFVQVFL